MAKSITRQYETSPLQGANAAFLEGLYDAYLADPASVGAEWRDYFAALAGERGDVAHGPIVRELGERLRNRPAAPARGGAWSAPAEASASEKQAAVSRLIQVYSLRGHQIADLDPLGL